MLAMQELYCLSHIFNSILAFLMDLKKIFQMSNKRSFFPVLLDKNSVTTSGTM
jgi:hypothetical protein